MIRPSGNSGVRLSKAVGVFHWSVGWSFDRDDVIEHERFFAIARQADRAAEGLPRTKAEVADEMMRDADIFREREEIQMGRAQHGGAVVRQLKETARPDDLAAGDEVAHEIDQELVPGPARVGMEFEALK